MSKKVFKQALELARVGDVAAALEELQSLERGFIRRRIVHYKAQPGDREAAERLDEALSGAAPLKPLPPLPEAPPDTVAMLSAPVASGVVRPAPEGAIDFDDPAPFLAWLASDWGRAPTLQFDALAYTDVWSLVAMASLILPERGGIPPIEHRGEGPVARFAHAVGLGAVAGGKEPALHDRSRTVRLTRAHTRKEVEPTADQMASLVIDDAEDHDMRLAIKYVLLELLRNVVQHSKDPLGAVAAAQVMGPAQRRERPMIQLAVADHGVGIPATLRRTHPHLRDDRQALERALLPHISGTFEEGLTGSFENAGLGLYMISELARQTAGRLLIATTGATLVLKPFGPNQPAVPRFLDPPGIGFPGTLVAFEIPSGSVHDYHALMQSILRKAQERTPKRASNRWLSFRPGPPESHRVHVYDAREDTLLAAEICADITARIVKRSAVELDFSGLSLCTQSWLHSLLFEPVRLAWALRVPVNIVGAEPAVQEGLRFLEAYALGG
ncbi:MAG: ATP-binding protein [Polyangiaceae bacterium]